jgi:hypothetical protein
MQMWGPETHNDVQVSKGLFHVVLGESVTLHPDSFGEALFPDVTVNGTVMPERQPVRTVAYAFGLFRARSYTVSLSALTR